MLNLLRIVDGEIITTNISEVSCERRRSHVVLIKSYKLKKQLVARLVSEVLGSEISTRVFTGNRGRVRAHIIVSYLPIV